MKNLIMVVIIYLQRHPLCESMSSSPTLSFKLDLHPQLSVDIFLFCQFSNPSSFYFWYSRDLTAVIHKIPPQATFFCMYSHLQFTNSDSFEAFCFFHCCCSTDEYHLRQWEDVGSQHCYSDEPTYSAISDILSPLLTLLIFSKSLLLWRWNRG